MSAPLKDLLLLGFPIEKDVLLPWKTPFKELLKFGNTRQEEWNRWEQDRDGYYFQNKKIRLKWKLQVPGLPSITDADLIYDKPENIFQNANLYFKSREQLEGELNQHFGEPYIHRGTYMDRDGENEYVEEQWIIRSPDSIKKVSFLLSGSLRIQFREGE